MKDIKIGKYTIGENHPPFIIAEMSGNHNQSLDRALEIVREAAKAGVHALKLQTYTADTITIDIGTNEFFISDPSSLWKGESLYELFKKAYTPWEWHQPIMDLCNELGLLCFSTPFDESAVDFLETLNVPCYKIASFENNHFPLIKKVIQTKKPIIISTGMCRLSDLDELIAFFHQNNFTDYVLLKCTSAYPSLPEDANLLTIPHLSKMFNCHVGLSDHTMGVAVSVASVALGAKVVEKHFTLKRADGGVDSAFSLEPAELKSLIDDTLVAWKALGKVNYTPTSNELKNIIHKRSIYITKDIAPGEILTSENVRVIRPGLGIHPKHYENLLGKKATQVLKRGQPLQLNHYE